MNSNLETNFKNSILKSVVAFGRTGGVHHPVLPQIRRTEDQIDGFSRLFFNSLHHTTPLHPTDPFPHLGPAKDPPKSPLIIDTRGHGSCRHAAVSPLWRRPPHRPSYPDAAPYYHACPLSRPHHAQQEPKPAGNSPPVRAVHRQIAPEAVPHHRALPARLHATRRAPP